MTLFRLLLCLAIASAVTASGATKPSSDPLAEGFATTPPTTQPWCYWYWISDQISREGITKDLEAMQRVGIREALIGNIFLDNQPAGRIKVLTEEWWQLVEHAVREGGRLGVDIGLFNCPGWSQSGGPWITSDKTMRYVASSEIRVTGPLSFTGKLPAPHAQFQDLAVLAFPAPTADADRFAARTPAITISTIAPDRAATAHALADGDIATSVVVAPADHPANQPVVLDFELPTALTARSLQIVPAEEAFGAEAELQARNAAGSFQTIRRFRADRSNPRLNTGFLPRGPVTISFPAATSTHFRLLFTQCAPRGKALALAEINLSPAARLEAFVEKQLGEMHPTPLPLADAYAWPPSTEPESPEFAVPVSAVRDLSAQLSFDGNFQWQVPPGEWVIQRLGLTPTGMKNAPASPEGKGFEVDKMNRRLAAEHFDAFIGELLRRLPPQDRRALKRVVADSYEMGSQNWTDDFAASFVQTYGYDPKPWLPVLSGRIVDSAEQSDRFLWDLRRLVADRVARDYVGGMNDAARQHGLGLWLENYGHWGFPGEFLNYGGQSDRIGGEFWVTGDLGSIECRAASSAANTYGKPFVSAESFTGGPPFQNAPRDLKARGDWSFTEGVNHVVLHVVIHQPNDQKIPGINAPWGTEFNRHNTWFNEAKAWVDYERRCSWLLQQGWRAADVAYFIGEDTPKMTGSRVPALPAGFDYDYINAEVIEKNLSVRDGRLVLPHGVSYRVLVLPPQNTMRPALLRKLRELVHAGATVIGLPPTRSPSLEDFPRADAEVQRLATELWGDLEVGARGEHHVGRGRTVWGVSLTEFFAAAATLPDVAFPGATPDANLLFTHRSTPDADIYFVTNQRDRTEHVDVAFRVTGRQPELWDAVTGARRLLPEWREANGRTIVPLTFAARQSWFIVFRQPGRPVGTSAKNFPAQQKLLTLTQPWQVAFEPRWGGPATVEFAQLHDWSTHSDTNIKHYSGRATYRTNFRLPTDVALKPGAPLYLDLGQVRDLAIVKINGRELGTLWTAPWQIDIANAVQAGENTLEITIVNTWNNRLVGDRSLPASERLTSLSLNTIKPDTPLLPAGLLGPVTLQTEP